MKSFEKLHLGPHETLQTYFNMLFESGIRQHVMVDLWQLQKNRKVFEQHQENEFIASEYLLRLDDVHGIFCTLLRALAMSFLVFTLKWICFKWDRIKGFVLRKMEKLVIILRRKLDRAPPGPAISSVDKSSAAVIQ